MMMLECGCLFYYSLGDPAPIHLFHAYDLWDLIMGLLVAAAVFATILGGFYMLLCHIIMRHKLKEVNSPRSLPVVGHALICKPDAEGFINQALGMEALYPTSPRMVLFWMGPLPLLMLYSAELVEPVLTSNKHLNKGFAYRMLEPWLGLSLLTSRGDRWRPKRKMLTPTFHYDILKDFIPVFNEQSRILVRKMSEKMQTDPWAQFEMLSLLSLCTLDIICETSMGRSVNAQDNEDCEYVRAVHTINDCVQQRTSNPLLWNDTINNWFGNGWRMSECLNVLHSFTRNVIEERRMELESRNGRQEGRPAFLDLLLEMEQQGSILTEDIQPEVDTFMFEGHDTTSTGLTWALHLIGNDPRVQKNIQLELEEVMGDRDEVTVDDLSRMKYLEACLKEALRLFPSVPMIVRELGDEQMLGGTVFPKGTHILLNQYLVHRDERYWPDPEMFKPERFLGEVTGRHAFAFIPFSAGMRNCIGQRFAYMEEKVVMAWILRHFYVHSVEKRWEVRRKIELILRPKDGIHVTLQERRPVY